MAKKPKITRREFLLARGFLNGLKGNSQNTYLILAVVAWMRAMGKAHDPYWKSLSRLAPSLAGARLARHLAAKAASGKYKAEYKAIISRLREQHAKGTAMANQAKDFILGIVKSHYDKKHYGYKPYVEGHYVTTYEYVPGSSGNPIVEKTVWVPEQQGANPLYNAWAALTNSPNIPDSWWITVTKTTKTKVIPPRPHQPRSLLHAQPQRDYIQPYQAQRWYDAKPHYGDNVLLDE